MLVEVPHRHQHKGVLYNVRIDMTAPGGELVVKREPAEDLYVAIRDAFDAARRQLQEFGYGFLETLDGREIYFHRNSLVNGDFQNLELGTEMRYVEVQGMEGPQASTVTIVGK